MFENPRRGRQARNFTRNVPEILDLKSSSEQIFPKTDVGCPVFSLAADDDGLLAALLPGSLQPNNVNVSNNMDTRHYAYCLTIHVNHASSE